jgi:1-acyl-sn-glycerol-3-phosphate acyltransferase
MSKQERSYSPGWRRFTLIWLPTLLRALIKHEWHGQENFPQEGGVILAPNHLSYADWPTLALFSHDSGRFPVFLIKDTVFKVKVVGPFLRKLGQMPVHRGRGDAALVLRDAERAIREENAAVIMYAEGTATRDPDLWPMKARTGTARLALATGAPVIPIAHWGAQDVLPYGSTRPHLFPRRTVKMIAGPPVDLSEFRDQPLNSATLRAATDAIMAEVTALLAGLRGETPPAEVWDMAAKARVARTTKSSIETNPDPSTGSGDSTAGETNPSQSTGSGDGTSGGPPAEARPT